MNEDTQHDRQTILIYGNPDGQYDFSLRSKPKHGVWLSPILEKHSDGIPSKIKDSYADKLFNSHLYRDKYQLVDGLSGISWQMVRSNLKSWELPDQSVLGNVLFIDLYSYYLEIGVRRTVARFYNYPIQPRQPLAVIFQTFFRPERYYYSEKTHDGLPNLETQKGLNTPFINLPKSQQEKIKSELCIDQLDITTLMQQIKSIHKIPDESCFLLDDKSEETVTTCIDKTIGYFGRIHGDEQYQHEFENLKAVGVFGSEWDWGNYSKLESKIYFIDRICGESITVAHRKASPDHSPNYPQTMGFTINYPSYKDEYLFMHSGASRRPVSIEENVEEWWEEKIARPFGNIAIVYWQRYIKDPNCHPLVEQSIQIIRSSRYPKAIILDSTPPPKRLFDPEKEGDYGPTEADVLRPWDISTDPKNELHQQINREKVEEFIRHFSLDPKSVFISISEAGLRAAADMALTLMEENQPE